MCVTDATLRPMTTNPFRYGALALDEAFTDREAEVEELLTDVLNGQDVVVFAPRRYGKSSLVWRVSQRAIAQDVLVAHVNLMTTPTTERLAEKLAETIHDDLASTLFRARERLRVFAGLRITPDRDRRPDLGQARLQLRRGPPAAGSRRDARAAPRASRASSPQSADGRSRSSSTSSRRSSISIPSFRS